MLTLGVSLGVEVDKTVAANRYQQILEQVRALPGVTYAAATNSLPYTGDGMNGGSFAIEGRPRAEGALPPVTYYTVVTEDYLPAIGTALKQGRALERADHDPGPRRLGHKRRRPGSGAEGRQV